MVSHERRVLRVALTGGIATGKTYVRQAFERLGVPTLDADVLAREAVAPGTPGLQQIVSRFGRDVLDPSGAIDRRRLGVIVFSDEKARKDLEAIVHPEVQKATNKWFASLDASRHPFAVYDIPLLFEADRAKDFDVILVVAARPEAQLRRLMERDRLAEDEARRRISAQWPIDEKVKRADYVIRTDGTFEDTDRQVQLLVDALRARASAASR